MKSCHPDLYPGVARLLYAFSFDGYIFVALRNACPSVLSAYIAQVSEYNFIFTVNLLHFYAF